MFEHPHLVHVEKNTLNYPSGKPNELKLIYEGLYNWTTNYAIHTWFRLYELEHGPESIKSMNTTYGEICRLVYYGNSRLITKKSKLKG